MKFFSAAFDCHICRNRGFDDQSIIHCKSFVVETENGDRKSLSIWHCRSIGNLMSNPSIENVTRSKHSKMVPNSRIVHWQDSHSRNCAICLLNRFLLWRGSLVFYAFFRAHIRSCFHRQSRQALMIIAVDEFRRCTKTWNSIGPFLQLTGCLEFSLGFPFFFELCPCKCLAMAKKSHRNDSDTAKKM